MRTRGRSQGFVESRDGYPDDLSDDDNVDEHIKAFIREFARTDFGRQVYAEVDQFGFPGVESAADLTDTQSAFLMIARNEERQRRKHGT